MAHIQLIGIVEPKSSDGKIWRFPYAFPIIIRKLLSSSHTFDLCDTHLHKKSRGELLSILANCDAQIYGISAYSEGYNFAKEIANTIRKNCKDAIIIAGGLIAKNDDVLLRNTEISPKIQLMIIRSVGFFTYFLCALIFAYLIGL